MVDTSDIDHLDPFDILDAEAERLYGFLRSMDPADWKLNTRCEGWTRREMVAHLASGAVYHTACLDDTLSDLFAKGTAAGASDLDSFNDWSVRERADATADEVLDEWRRLDLDARRRMRERGRDGTMSSSVGLYPVGLMAVHIASEYATHYDDMDGPLNSAELEARTAWREKVSRFALREAEKDVKIEEASEGYVVRAAGKEAQLSRPDLVEAVVGRLKTIEPDLQQALRALA